jgi:uncharacterized protein YjiS (DUF1127 family)
MTDTLIQDRAAAAESGGAIAGLAQFISRWFVALRARWVEAERFRSELSFVSSLPDRELADMGFTRHDIAESRRLGRWVRAADEEEVGW